MAGTEKLWYWAFRLREQLFQRLAQSDLPNDSLTKQLTFRATRPTVTLPVTRPELCYWVSRHREQLIQRLVQ
jgi:hypothetical protein